MSSTGRRRASAATARPESSGAPRAGVQKVSVSLATEDVAWAREQAVSRHVSVSAVVSEALRRQRQAAALGRLLSRLGGKLSAGELSALRAELYANA